MKNFLWRVASVALALSLGSALPAVAQQASTTTKAVVTLPATGTFARGGQFAGTVTINRFEREGNQVFAVGFVSGVLSRGPGAIGSAFAGEKRWPVAVSSGTVLLANGRPSALMPTVRVAWEPGVRPHAEILRMQAEPCSVLKLALGPINVDLLGIQVALSPVTFDLAGAPGTPLGDLVCEASRLVGNVAGLVGLLNDILGLLTGLLGGLTGGLGGGAVPLP